jgi:hypothetical protein
MANPRLIEVEVGSNCSVCLCCNCTVTGCALRYTNCIASKAVPTPECTYTMVHCDSWENAAHTLAMEIELGRRLV